MPHTPHRVRLQRVIGPGMLGIGGPGRRATTRQALDASSRLTSAAMPEAGRDAISDCRIGEDLM